MKVLLLIIATLLPIIYSIYNCVNRNGKIEISFVLTFSIGFLYYSVLPMYFGVFHLALRSINLTEWFTRYNQIPDFRISQYLMFVIVIYLVLILTLEKLFPILSPKFKSIEVLKLVKKTKYNCSYEKYWFIFFIFLGGYSFFRVSTELFSNYDWTNTTNRSIVSAFSMFVLSFSILTLSEKKINSFLEMIFNRWTVLLILTSIILLMLGGRLYVMTIILSYIIYYTYFIDRINLKFILVFGICILLIVGFVGITRSGLTNVSVFSILDNVLVESIYNFFSTIDYLIKYDIAIVNMPIGLLGSIILLIPSPIFPGKNVVASYFVNSNYQIESLVGGMNIFPSLNVEFGVIGSIIFFCIIFILLERFRKSDYPLFNTIYILFSGNLLFTFFRDPFAISLTKNIFQFSILMPIIYCFLPRILILIKDKFIAYKKKQS